MYVSLVATGFAPFSSPFGCDVATAVGGEATKQAFMNNTKPSPIVARRALAAEGV